MYKPRRARLAFAVLEIKVVRLPPKIVGDRRYWNAPPITRVAASAFGFLTLIQAFDGPDL